MSAQGWQLRARCAAHSQVWRDALAMRDAGDLCDRTRWAAGVLLTGEARGLDCAAELAALRDEVRTVAARVARIREVCGG